MHRVSVSNLECFRQWRDDEDLDTGWLMDRLLGRSETTPAMAAGNAFHEAIENSMFSEFDSIEADGYRFDFDSIAVIELPAYPNRELPIEKTYGDVLVRGRVDCFCGRTIYDHKTTAQFDADRLMSGFQWRYYLDILEADVFRWNIFVLRENDDPKHYTVVDFHQLEQRRYPELQADCARLAAQFEEFAKENLRVAV